MRDFFLDTIFQEPYTFPNCNLALQIRCTSKRENRNHGNSKKGSQESTRQEGSKKGNEEEVILWQEGFTNH
jgi:hypothetical protein